MRKEIRRPVVALLLLFVFALQLVRVCRVFSAAWDEPRHLFDGYIVRTHHDYGINPEVPPLVRLAAALPLQRMQLQYIEISVSALTP